MTKSWKKKNSSKVKKIYQKDYQKYPAHHIARSAVNRLVKEGKLSKTSLLKCAGCGNQATEYDHYKGYERENWTKVEAVCSQCNHNRRRELLEIIKLPNLFQAKEKN